MENKFKIKIEEKNEKEIKLRFYSREIVNLSMKDIKFFFSHDQFDKNMVCMYPIILNNSAKIIHLYFPNSQRKYTSVNFLLRKGDDNSNMLAVRVNLRTNEVEITETDFKI